MKKIWLVLGMLIFVTPMLVGAAEFQSGNSYSLAGTERVNTDIYAAGGSVSVQGAVNGDAVLAGGVVSVTGSTTQSILAAGGNLMLTGKVGDDIRAAGGNITVGGMVTNDVVIAGGQLTILPDAQIGGDAVLTGGSIAVNGQIGGKAIIRGGNVTIGGRISGPVTIEAQSITISKTAILAGELTYKSPQQARVEDGARISGTVNYTPIAKRAAGSAIVSALVTFLTLFVSALVLGLLLKKLSLLVATDAHTRFWWDVLWGFLFLIVTPIVIGILFITVLGIPIAVVLLMTYIAMLVLAYVFSVVAAGALLNKWLFKRSESEITWLTILVGAVAVFILSLIPIIGWIANALLMLMALGAFFKSGSSLILDRAK